MKIMTLNTHSLAEPEYESKLAAFAGSLVQLKPDIIALQEVNQSRCAPPAASGRLRESGYVPCCAKDLSTATPCASRAVIRADNHALNLALLLARSGVSYQWTWTPAKIGIRDIRRGPGRPQPFPHTGDQPVLHHRHPGL